VELDRAGYVLYAPAERVALTDGTVLASLTEPYFNRTMDHFCSHLHAPERRETAQPGMVLGRDGVYIAGRVFREYAKIGSLAAKRFVFGAIERLIGGSKSVALEGYPTAGIVTVMEQKQEHRSVLHLVYAQRITKGEKHVEVIEDVPTLYGVSVRFRPSGAVKSVTVVPDGERLSFSIEEDGTVSFTVPRMDIHAMIEIAYLSFTSHGDREGSVGL
jgi:hypothetical protein